MEGTIIRLKEFESFLERMVKEYSDGGSLPFDSEERIETESHLSAYLNAKKTFQKLFPELKYFKYKKE